MNSFRLHDKESEYIYTIHFECDAFCHEQIKLKFCTAANHVMVKIIVNDPSGRSMPTHLESIFLILRGIPGKVGHFNYSEKNMQIPSSCLEKEITILRKKLIEYKTTNLPNQWHTNLYEFTDKSRQKPVIADNEFQNLCNIVKNSILKNGSCPALTMNTPKTARCLRNYVDSIIGRGYNTEVVEEICKWLVENESQIYQVNRPK